MMRSGADSAGDVVAVRVERWQAAFAAWQQATARRDRLVDQTARDIDRATGGLGLRRWEAACRRRRIRTTADAAALARAIRARPAVDSALRGHRHVEAVEDAAVAAALVELADASRAVVGLGRLAEQLTGLGSAELGRLARGGGPPQSAR